jgi:ArsR family transcriptional regulator
MNSRKIPPLQEISELHANLCFALADPRRIMLIYTLAEHPQSVSDLVTALEISQPAASRHLKILRERGLVKATRQGAHVKYQLNDPRLVEALDILRAILRDQLARSARLFETHSSEG